MERRDLLKMIAAATGTAFFSSAALAYEVTEFTKVSDTGFSSADLGLINEIAETIIPKTDTPGAKDANVANIIAVMVADCFTPKESVLFKQGLVDIQKRAVEKHSKAFVQLSKQQKLDILNPIDQQAKLVNAKRWTQENHTPHYFTIIKQIVIFCFFTSEKGAKEALRFVAIPGRYDGEFPYKPGDKAWAT